MKKAVIWCFIMVLLVGSAITPFPKVANAETPGDLLISEYVEGSSYNKAIEIFNGTREIIDLSDYTVELYSNGATTASTTYDMEGTLANGDVFVISDSQAGEAIQNVTDVNSGVVSFNGDDPLVLKKGGEVVDSIGQIGSTDEFGKDVTLLRKADVAAGDTDATDAFETADQWDQYAKDTFEYLGNAGVPESEAGEVQSIADARQVDSGQTVTVEGIATASFEAGGQINLYIQDDTAGIIVRGPGITASVGDQVKATGEFDEYYGMQQISTSSAQVEVTAENAGVPEAQIVDAAQFTADAGEEIEAEFVQVGPVEITEKNQYGDFTAQGENGTFLITPENEDFLEIGKTYEQIKGVVNYSYSNYKLVPRTQADIIEKVFAVTASPSSGQVVKGTEVTLNTAEPGATIHYTVDGSQPTADSQEYTDAIVIEEDVTIKAVAVRDNGDVSDVATFTYTALKPLNQLEIHDVQGAAHTSPYEGQVVQNVEGVVTKVDGSNSFFMQSTNPDDNSKTSEGIYVYKRTAGVEVGDLVSVTGKVKEWREDGYSDADDLLTTEINGSSLEVVSSDQALPEPVVIGDDRTPPTEIIENDALDAFDPEEDGLDFYESLEGMLIELPEAKVTGPVKYDELPVYVETSENQLITDAGGLLISPNDYNPERMLIDVDGIDVQAKTGDFFKESITGVVSYDYSNYKIRVTGEFPEIYDGGTEREAAKLKGLNQKMTVASYNVENFSAETNPKKVAKIAESIVENLNTPDVVGLIEMQDNNGATDDGTVDASESYQTLIDAIVEAGGPRYAFTDIAPQDKTDGGQPGGNIRVGFIYNPDRVTLTDKPSGDAVTAVDVNDEGLTLNPGRVDPTNDAFYDSRKPLAAEFEFNGEKVVIVANHFNSKGGDDGLFGASQPVELGSEKQRIEQAKVINNFVQKVESEVDNANVVVLGDLNDFEFSAPIETLEGDILANMIEEVPHDERYTYIYQGNSQVLDHILVSKDLKKQTKIETVNINADFSEADGRASDHDPVLAQIHIKKDNGHKHKDWFPQWLYSIWNKYLGDYFGF
ncbi:chitobiase/beta-hexosaminidase C-terminal domain-containing protein [Halobacillus sp. BBL2006]|uniref:chitobiase/beta-hexosaminidase C-terminal domain-containing protein n=1 Tax=Halobacillus sp. BBL2006 TaxID=1543706 RepID=UPI0009DED5E6|nr:chitobiase/beta-hexosaminidase C-terminal domain-containing protein [Halobacillus sp. BBL2006]